jgi:hypothetical protein
MTVVLLHNIQLITLFLVIGPLIGLSKFVGGDQGVNS